jgi:predicted permease
VVLLTGAGLTLNSFAKLLNTDPGFEPRNVLTMFVQLPIGSLQGKSGTDSHAALERAEEALARIRRLPGVQSAATCGDLPMEAGSSLRKVKLSGRTTEGPEEVETVADRWASYGYFKTMRIPVLKGRAFNSEEADPDLVKVAVINQAMASRFWPDEDPIGQHINDLRIVGVVGNVRMCGLDNPVLPEYYTPFCSLWNQIVMVRTDRDPSEFIANVQAIITDADREVTISRTATMEEVISRSVARPRFVLFLLGSFAVLAVILAVVGIYGVMAYSVSLRTHEFGIRMALGAQRSHVLWIVLKQGLALTVIGLAAGLAGAFALTRYLRSLLYEVSSTDPLTFAAVTVLLGAVAMLACYTPARRSTRIDPIAALRRE